jgi:hypothetical protein
MKAKMTRSGTRATALLSLLFMAVISPLAAAAHDRNHLPKVDAILYEVTENMALDDLAQPTLRSATAALQGTAQFGTPLCPADVVRLLLSIGLPTRVDRPCTITAIGSDIVDTATGAGTLTGIPPAGGFSVVINLDNTTDPPEFVVMTGKFEGTMQVLVDTSVNPPRQLPLIALTGGTFTPLDVLGVPIEQVAVFGLDPASFSPVNFTGVFRLPFSLDRSGKRGRPHHGRDAFYLAERGQLIKVKPEERSLGFPTVRIEIDF